MKEPSKKNNKMREIKFRFWDARSDEWCDSENWLPSDVRFDVNETFELALKDGIVVQQYTGLKDKNDVEIYEGDIFKDDYWWVGRATVEFANGVFGFECGDEAERDFRPIIQCEHIEVIGNIFEGVDK